MMRTPAVPAARPQAVPEAQRVMQAIARARTMSASRRRPGAGPAATSATLPRASTGPNVVDHQDVADVARHLGRDVSVVLVHVEAVHADAAGHRFREVRTQILKPPRTIRLPRPRPCRLRAAQLRRNGGLALRPSEPASSARSSAAAGLRPAGHLRSLLTIMMSPITRALWLCESRILEMDLRHHARLARVRDVEDGGAEPRACWAGGRCRRSRPRRSTWPAPGRSSRPRRRTFRESETSNALVVGEQSDQQRLAHEHGGDCVPGARGMDAVPEKVPAGCWHWNGGTLGLIQAVVTSFKPNLAGLATMLLISVKASNCTMSMPGSAARNCASVASRPCLKPKLNAVAAPRT